MDIQQQLRTHIKKQRAILSTDNIKQTSLLIAKRLKDSFEFTQAKHIAYYLPVAGEADPTMLLQARHGTGKAEFYLPVLKKKAEKGLHFIKVGKTTKFIKNQYGIPEPEFTEHDLIKPEKLDLVITPLVSFDLQGNRVGMGGGFYDRTFGFKQSEEMRKPLLIGYAYEFQYSDKIVPNTWDVKLDGVVTENKFTRC